MSEHDYEVGYKKPPKYSQFKPGQSGNPNGRPKGSKNLATDLREEMAEQVSVNEAGTHKITTKQRAMLKALVAKALKGDTRAIGLLMKYQLGLEEKLTEVEADVLAPEDSAILDAYCAEVLKGHGQKEKADA